MSRRTTPPPQSQSSPKTKGRVPPEPPSPDMPQCHQIAHQLKTNSYECLICTENIRHNVATWSCSFCYRIFHLFCTKKWSKAEGSGEGTSFRCPNCQSEYKNYPNAYNCFCGRVVDPVPDGFVTPHSCGDICGKKRQFGCSHACSEKCHPGPCPDCLHKVSAVCPCGLTKYSYTCGKPDSKQTCSNECGKTLNCGVHLCSRVCHHGPCDPCNVQVEKPCICGSATKKLVCGSGPFTCEKICGKKQKCGQHACPLQCHSGSCPPCDSDPEVIFSCPCGKVPVTRGSRKVCTDEIPVCGSVCGKVLLCGNHYCNRKCHLGPCGECEAKITASCKCGAVSSKVYCRKSGEFHCEKKCKAKLSCGRHDCQVTCCESRRETNAAVHQCRRECRRQLPCGHICHDPCHRGPCPSCTNLVTDELYCACGSQVLIPPQPCGTKPPLCNLPCRKELQCGHPPTPHTCHFGDCPKCFVKVDRMCIGDHVVVKGVACSAENISCGGLCMKPLTCGHKCPKRCHPGPCQEEGKVGCQQKCEAALPCGHLCRQRCHPTREQCGACTTTVDVPCECGIKIFPLLCKDFLKKKEQLAEGETFQMPCTNDCMYERRLAALKSVGAGSHAAHNNNSKIVYGLRLFNKALQQIDAVATTERHLQDFVTSKLDSKMLPPMNKDRRALVHELCFYYNIQCEAVDREPNRTCQLTRTDKTYVPSPLLSAAVYLEESNPSTIAAKILKNVELAKISIIVFEGHFTEITLIGWLKQFSGKFFILQPEDVVTIAPQWAINNKTAPKTTMSGEPDNVPYLAVFPSPSEASSVYSALRRQSIPVTYHRFGEQPPLRNTVADAGNIVLTPDLRATHYCDPTAMTAGMSTEPKGGPAVDAGNRGSYASLLRDHKETARQKETRRAVQIDSGNKFAALSKKK